MKYILSTLSILLLGSAICLSQIYNPVKWEHRSVKTGPNTYDIIFQAEIEDGWNIYSQYLENEDGPIPTSFNFDEGDHFSLKGKNVECDFHRKEAFDKLFNMNVVKYQKKAIFRQTIISTDPTKQLTGYLEFMTCDDEKCLPPAQIDFEIDLSKSFDEKAIQYSDAALCQDEVKFVAVSAPTDAKIAANDKQSNTSADQKVIDQKKTTKKELKAAVKAEKINAKTAQKESKVAINGLKSNQSKLEDPVKWTSSITRLENGNTLLELKADIEKGWYIYSNSLESDDGPLKTDIVLDESEAYTLIGGIKESADDISSEFDNNFDMTLTKLKKHAAFSQLLDIKDETKPIKGFFQYMSCTNSKCLAPQYIDFEAKASDTAIKFGSDLDDASSNTTASFDQLEDMYGLSAAAIQAPIGSCSEKVVEKKSIWGIFILGFLGGLIALLTPCVFPMIPLTVSFFTKSTEKKGQGLFNAIFYGLSILMVYVLISVPFHLLDTVNPNILNDISTNVILNIAFFLIFLFFAFSFFGYFDLTLPASVTNRISAAEGVGGVLGIFFMALTLALVSFSCTGPILGSLLAGSLSSDGGAWELTSGFAGFGLALGLPFGLFAAFPSMMNSLPKSGGWLNTVKVVLGFIELALAFKFLSNADLVKQWGLLKIEPFLVIWIFIALGLGLYLFGKLKFPHDSPIKKLSFGRIGFGIMSIAFAVYLMSGFRYSEKAGSYQSLSLLSGLAPPVCYSWIHKCKCPQGLECFKDLKEGMAYAQEVNKPILIDFTGHACVNCRKMEEHIWPQPEVYSMIKNDYVLISLYVDEKIELPIEEQVTLTRSSGGTQKMRYTGNRWAFFQTEYFNINSQPYYVLLSPDGEKLLNTPVAYTPDKDEYAEFLECGLRNYRQLGEK
jgi:thiol:disulfide interchange protein DsbD